MTGPDRRPSLGTARRAAPARAFWPLVGIIALTGCASGPELGVELEPVAAAPVARSVPPNLRAAETAPLTSPTAGPSTTAPAAASPEAAPRGSAPPVAAAASGRSLSTLVTFYAAYDNDPPGSTAIAHPNARHPRAGGTGTYADPLTLASDPRELPVGTVVYYPPLRKYFVMEDDCESCQGEWGADRTYHIDLWTGAATDSGVTACQHALTPAGPVTVELDPPPGRPVGTTPLYANGRCIVR